VTHLKSILVATATALGAPVFGQTTPAPQPLGDRIEFTASGEITQLDRRTRRLVSSAIITARNVGDAPVRPPFVVVVGVESPQGAEQITVEGAAGAIGAAPWN
jgi:hypothetical protein